MREGGREGGIDCVEGRAGGRKRPGEARTFIFLSWERKEGELYFWKGGKKGWLIESVQK